MSNLIVTKSGKPYATEKAAQIQQGIMRKQGVRSRVVEYEGGWALEKKERRKKRKKSLTDKGPMSINEKIKDPGYVYRYVNDVRDRIPRMIDDDWEIDTQINEKSLMSNDVSQASSVGKRLERVAGYIGGTEMKAVLMRKKKEYYEEDMEDKHDRLLEIEKSITGKPKDKSMYGEVEFER